MQTLAPEVPFFDSFVLKRTIYFTDIDQLQDPELELLQAEVDSTHRSVCGNFSKKKEAADPGVDISPLFGLKKAMGTFLAGVRAEQHKRRIATNGSLHEAVDAAVAVVKHELKQVRSSRDYWRAEAEALGAAPPAAIPGEVSDPTVVKKLLKGDPDAMRVRARLTGLSNDLQQRLGRKATATMEARFMDLCARELPPAEFTRLAGLAAAQGRQELEAAGAELLQTLEESASVMKAISNGCLLEAEPMEADVTALVRVFQSAYNKKRSELRSLPNPYREDAASDMADHEGIRAVLARWGQDIATA